MTEKLKFIGEKLDKLAGKMLLILCICILDRKSTRLNSSH